MGLLVFAAMVLQAISLSRRDGATRS